MSAALAAREAGHIGPATIVLFAIAAPPALNGCPEALFSGCEGAVPVFLAEDRAALGAWPPCRASGQEVVLVLETPDQRAVGTEIKASASLTQGDFDGLRELRRAAERAFTRGVVLYTGDQLLPCEDDLWAVPMGVLWAGGCGGLMVRLAGAGLNAAALLVHVGAAAGPAVSLRRTQSALTGFKSSTSKFDGGALKLSGLGAATINGTWYGSA